MTLDEAMDANRKAIKVIKDGLELIDSQQRQIWMLTAFCGLEALMIVFLSYKVFI
jgi:hypothetical protein